MKIKIEKGIPIPKHRGTLTPILAQLVVGDSFIVEERGVLASVWIMAKRLKIKVTSRTTPDGIRVWRIE